MLNNALPWVLAAALAFGLSAVACAGYSSEPPEPVNLPSAVPTQACPPGFVGIWIDDTTAECLRELP